MVKIPDIKDTVGLRTWLEDQPREVSVWIAARAAARVLPGYWRSVLTVDRTREGDGTALPVLRSLLISSVAALVPTDDTRSAVSAAIVTADVSAHDAAVYVGGTANELVVAEAHAAAATAFALSAAESQDNVVARIAADAAEAATHSVEVASGDDDFWIAIRADAKRAEHGVLPNGSPLWPTNAHPLKAEWIGVRRRVELQVDAADWQFWLDWYDAQLAGRTMLPDPVVSWETLEQIALIDPDTWDAGPEVVNPKIREIWEGYKDGASASGHAADPEPVSEDAKSAMKQRVAVNRDALVVASAGIIDQLGTFKEQVRGMNHLEPEVREEVLTFIDEFSGKLSSLIHGLPATGTGVDDDQAGRLVLWLREYRGLLHHKLAYYGSAENMADATVPTGIILGATGIGAMLGMPVAGSVVGGLIVNQMKPGQAARELTKPSGKDTDLP